MTTLLESLAAAPQAVRTAATHSLNHGDEDGYGKHAPGRREIALAMFAADAIERTGLSDADRSLLEGIERALTWVTGWGDLDPPEPATDLDEEYR